MKKAKEKIDSCIRQYKVVFKDEYKEFLKQSKAKEKREYVGNIKKDNSSIKRAMWDMPETLYTLIVQRLEGKEVKWFARKGSRGGQQYITKNYKEFAIPQKI